MLLFIAGLSLRVCPRCIVLPMLLGESVRSLSRPERRHRRLVVIDETIEGVSVYTVYMVYHRT